MCFDNGALRHVFTILCGAGPAPTMPVLLLVGSQGYDNVGMLLAQGVLVLGHPVFCCELW
jgi:hypothetical protein